MSDPIASFVDWMASKGWQPERTSDIVPDDKDHYIRAAGDKIGTKKLKYVLKVTEEGAIVGGFVHYREGEWHTYPTKLNGIAKEYTEEQRAAFRARIEAEKKAKEEERLKTEQRVAHEAKIIWDGAEYAKPDHPYLVKKRIKPHNFKQYQGSLLIPMWADKKFHWFQAIDADGDKKFGDRDDKSGAYAGGRTRGCYCPLMEKGESTDVFLLCEGPATGATIREIIGLPTIICFTASNLMPVAEDFRKRYPQSKLILAADNDCWARLKPTDPEKTWVPPEHEKNVGIFKAQQAAVKVGCARAVYPVFPKDSTLTDWNDLSLAEGEEAVRARIDEALSAPMPEPPKPKPVPVKRKPREHADWEQQLIFRDKEGVKLAENSINYKLMVCNHPRLKDCFAYDEFHLCTMVVQPPPWAGDDFKVHPLSDTDERNTDYFLQKVRDLKGSKEKTRDAIEECGLQNSFHPARDHLASLVWDGTPRLDNWLLTYVKAKDDPAYVRAVGAKWMIAAVKRLMEPGCKFDNMLILEGPQESGKSMTFEIMSRFGGSASYETYFMNTFNITSAEDTDELMKLAGAVIIEIQEMSGFNKKDDDAMKKFITTTHDTYRAPYGRRPQKWPRQFVLGGTYNPRDGIFKDSTGLRRFWVVETGPKIDLAGLERDREQLWAEAAHRYKSGESILLNQEMSEQARIAAENRRIIDDSTADVLEAARGRRFFETRDILQAMGITLAPGKSQAESRTINEILRVQGFRRKKTTRANKTMWGWEPPEWQPVQEDLYTEQEQEIDF